MIQKNYSFCYNYRFIKDWFDKNPEYKRCDVMHNMGMTYYHAFLKWLHGQTMVPVDQMLRFCNTYNVPITAFFLREGADENSIFAPIEETSQIEPTDGWKPGIGKQGETSSDPRTDKKFDSVLPDYCKHDGTVSPVSCTDGADSGNALIQTVFTENAKTNRDIQKERVSYIGIIENQSKTIARLQNCLSELVKRIPELDRREISDFIKASEKLQNRQYVVNNSVLNAAEPTEDSTYAVTDKDEDKDKGDVE